MTEQLYVSVNGQRIEATGEILAELLATQAQIKADAEVIQAQADKNLAAKAAAQAKLAVLGLTTDDLKALGL